ncbi:MAG: hypothetical protein ACRDD1_18170 [Planctomycetia bacterium]
MEPNAEAPPKSWWSNLSPELRTALILGANTVLVVLAAWLSSAFGTTITPPQIQPPATVNVFLAPTDAHPVNAIATPPAK